MKTYRAVVLGAAGSGKSALIRRFVNDEFVSDYEPTIEEKYTKKATYAGIPIALEVIDTSGKELVAAQHSRYLEHADAFVVVYSVDSRKSLEHAISIFSAIANRRGTHSVPRVLVGTKLDSPLREVSRESGNVLSAQLQCSFAETSALHGTNVLDVFEEVISQIRYIEGMKLKMQQNSSHGFCCDFFDVFYVPPSLLNFQNEFPINNLNVHP